MLEIINKIAKKAKESALIYAQKHNVNIEVAYNVVYAEMLIQECVSSFYNMPSDKISKNKEDIPLIDKTLETARKQIYSHFES